MGDDIRKIYDELSSLGSITVPYDQFADAYTKRADYKQKIDNAYTELFPDVKKKDVSQSPSVSASGVTSSPSQGDTIKVDGKEIPYEEFLTKYVKGEEVFGAPVELEEAPVMPEMSTAENLWNSAKIGLLNLQQAVYELPRTLYNIAAIPQNIVADQFGVPSLETNYDNFLAQTSSKGISAGNPLELVDQIAKMSAEDIAALQSKKAQDGLTITEIYDKEGFGAASEKIGEYVLESLPISIATIAGGVVGASRAGAMAAPSALADFSAMGSGVSGGLLSFPSHKKELEKYDLEQWETDGLALVFSGLESVFEGPANKLIASQTAKVLLESGEDAAKDFAANATKSIFNKALVPLLGASASGSSSEMATKYSQNLVTKLTVNPEINVFEGVADAGFVGAVSDPAMVSVPLSYQMIGNTANYMKTRKQRTAAISEIEAALEDETLPVEVRDNLANARETLISNFNADALSVNAMYESMSGEDKEQVTEISKKILTLSKALGRRDLTDVQRQAIEGTFTELSFQKAQIESKYQKPISDDSENQIGLPGQVVQGQESVQAQPIEGAGQETPQAGGVLQVPVQEEEVEPTWLGKPMADVIDSRLPEELTKDDIESLAKSIYGDVMVDPGQLQDIQKIYSLGKKVAKGEMNFTDDELNLYAQHADVIDSISNQIKEQVKVETTAAKKRQAATSIANKVLSSAELSEEDTTFYSENQEEVEAAIYEARAVESRAAAQLPEMVRQEQKKRAPKTVTMTDKAVVRQRIQDMITGAKGALNEVANLQESVKEMIDELTTAGALTAKQAASLTKAALDIRVNRPSSAKRFADTYERVIKGAQLDAQNKKASNLREKLKGVAKQRFTPFNIKEVISKFLSVDPNRTDDIGVYIQMAEAMMAVAKSRNINKSSIERILPYIDGQDSLSRAINRKPLKGYAQEARMRGYMNEVIMAYVQDQFDQAREVRMDAIAEAAGISREELDSSVAQIGEDEILSGYYDAEGNTITMPDGSRRTIEKDIVERMRNVLSRDGINTKGLSDREVQDIFVRNQERVRGDRNEKARALVNAKVSIIRTEGLSDVISSAKYRDVSGLSLRELSALNSMLDNIINNGSQANAGNAKILLEKTGRVEQIKDVLARKKVSNFTEKLFGVIGADKFNKRPVFFRFDQIIEQISGRADIGTILDELGYNDFRVNEAASDVILVNARKAINEATAQINKKYGVDITSAENKVKATILQLFVQARNPMNKQNESIIVNSILDNLRATATVYSQGNAESIEIADAINTFLNRVGTPKYVDNVVGFAMLDAVETEARKYAGAPVSEYVDIWKGIHEQHVDMYADYLEAYRNERLKRENNYTAISVVKSGASMDGFFDEFEPAAQSSSEINVFARINKQFNRLIAAPKSKNFIERNPSYQLSDGDFYNMNFTAVQDKALNASVRESVVGPSIRTMASMASSSGAIKLFNTSASDNTNSEALSTTLSNEIGAEYAFRNFDFQSVQIIKNIAGTAIFGSVFEQFFKQSGPALLATQIRTTMYNKRAAGATAKAIKFVATSRSNPKSKALIDALLAKSDVQQRDLTATVVDPTSQLKVIGSKINGMKNASKFFGVVNEATTQIRNLTMMPLRQGDRVAAQASYLAFLDEAYLSKYGKQFTYEEMLEKNDPEMFAKASFELRSAQNVNSGKAMAQALRPGDSNASFVQATLLSWGSFAVNFKAGLYNDIANLRSAKDKKSAQMAMASVSARLSEAISYSSLLVYGLPLLYSGLGSALFGADDEYTEGLDDFLQSEEKFKRFYSRIVSEVIPTVNNIPGISQMTLLMSDLLLEGLNHLYYTMSPMEQEQGLTKSDAERIGLLPFKTYPTEAQDLLGKYTTSLQLAADSKESLSIASTGKYTDEKRNTYYYDEEQRKALYKIGTVQAMASAGFTLSEVKSAANASLRAIRATKYKDEFERYIQAESIESMPEDFITEADRTMLELMRSGAAIPAEIKSAILGYPFKYSELYSKMQGVNERAAGILLYNRIKGEAKDAQDSIVGEIAYRATVDDKNALKIFEEYMFEKNRVEKLGYTKEQIIEMAAGMQEKLEKAPQKLDELDKKQNAKKIEKRLNELSDFLNQELDKQ